MFKAGDKKAERIHAPFVSDDLIVEHVSSLREMRKNLSFDKNTDIEMENKITFESNIRTIDFKSHERQEDDLYLTVVEFVKEAKQASASAIQSQFNIGYPRALKLMNKMKERGVIGEREYHNGPCGVLI